MQMFTEELINTKYSVNLFLTLTLINSGEVFLTNMLGQLLLVELAE